MTIQSCSIESLESRTLLAVSPTDLAFLQSEIQNPQSEISLKRSITATPQKKRAASVTVDNHLRVSPDGHSLLKPDGSPFFYLADTAWRLFDRTTREQADRYLETRAAQGFTVVQAEVNAGRTVSLYDERAFIDNDPTRPNPEFFEHVDYCINKANSLGIYVSLVALDTQSVRGNFFNNTTAYTYARWVANRYRNAKVIWTLGGDTSVNDTPGGIGFWRAVAAGVARGATGKDINKPLFNYHPFFNESTSTWFQNESWMDIISFHSGHGPDRQNYIVIDRDYHRTPTKPVMDVEPGYEGMPAGLKLGNTRLTAWDSRKSAYLALFAGAAGATYGHNNVWQFITEENLTSRSLADGPWTSSLNTPGAIGMKHLKKLMLSRPQSRVPDQSLIVGAHNTGVDRLQAIRGTDNSYAFIYTASGKPITANLTKLSGNRITARWYNPRSGKVVGIGTMAKTGNQTFTPPASGTNYDWVLILDDAGKGYGKP